MRVSLKFGDKSPPAKRECSGKFSFDFFSAEAAYCKFLFFRLKAQITRLFHNLILQILICSYFFRKNLPARAAKRARPFLASTSSGNWPVEVLRGFAFQERVLHAPAAAVVRGGARVGVLCWGALGRLGAGRRVCPWCKKRKAHRLGLRVPNKSHCALKGLKLHLPQFGRVSLTNLDSSGAKFKSAFKISPMALQVCSFAFFQNIRF